MVWCRNCLVLFLLFGLCGEIRQCLGAPAAGGDAETPRPVSDPLDRPISFVPDKEDDRPKASDSRFGNAGITTMVGGLAVCVGAFLLFVWATRRTASIGMAPLPSEVLESLGRAPLNGRQHLQLIRLGQKLVLLCVSPQGATALSEVTDRDEVTRLAGFCQQSKTQSVTTSFREALGEYGREAPTAGLFGKLRSDGEYRSTPRRST